MAEVLSFSGSSAPVRPPSFQPFLVTVMPVEDGWLTVCRQHGWLHATCQEALADASVVAAGFGVGLLVHLGRRA